MAISLHTAGSWVAANATTQTVTLPTHSTGDMLLVRVAFKHATMPTTVTCGTAGWAKVSTEYNNGTTASGNGTGSVEVATFWKEAASASETDPVITFNGGVTAATPSAAVAMSYSKGAGEAWVTPVGNGGSVGTTTSLSATITSHISTTAGDLVDFYLSQGDNDTLTVPTFTQTGLTLAAVVVSPVTALSDATSNDIDAHGGYRIVNSGTSSAAAVATATSSAGDQGSAWTTRLRVAAADTAPAELASATGAAYDATVTAKTTAGLATGTGVAYDATVAKAKTAAAELGAGTGAAYAATVAVRPTAGLATGAAAAFDATVETGSVGDTAPAEVATATGAAFDATVASASIPAAGLASGTGAAFDATGKVAPTAGVAAGTGAAYPATPATGPTAGLAAGTGAAFAATVAGKTTAGLAAATGAAFDATVSTLTNEEADAGLAAGTGDAYAATAQVSASAAVAAALGAAYDGTGAVAAILGLAAGTGAAYDATVEVGQVAPAEVAAASGSAHDATIAIGVAAGLAAVAVAGYDARGLGDVRPGLAAQMRISLASGAQIGIVALAPSMLITAGSDVPVIGGAGE